MHQSNCQQLLNNQVTAAQTQDGYEFLDLSDVGDVERFRLSTALLQHQEQQPHQEPAQPHNIPLFRLPRPIFFAPKVFLVPLLNKEAARFNYSYQKDDERCDQPSHSLSISGHENPDHRSDVQFCVNQPFSPPDLPNVNTDCLQAPPSHPQSRVQNFIKPHYLFNSVTTMSPHTGGALHTQQPAPQQSQPNTTQQSSQSGGPSQPQNVTSNSSQQSQQPQPALLSSQPPLHTQHPAAPQSMYGVPAQGFVHGGGVYQMMSPAVPGSVFVSNVTANVNLHGYIPHSTPMHYMSANAPPFIPAEQLQQQQQQQQQVALSSSVGLHEQAQQIQPSTNIAHMRGGVRRGRGRSNGLNRRDFSTRPSIGGQDANQQSSDPQQQQSQQQTPQQQQQPQQQPQQHHMHQIQPQHVPSSQIQQNQQQQPLPNQQQQQPHQALMHHNYPAYPGYPYNYYAQSAPVQVGYPSAQHATGTPLYANHMPMYVPAPPYYYHPSIMYPQIVSPEYAGMIDGNKDDGGPEPTGQVQSIAWQHPTQIAWHPNMPQAQPHNDEYMAAEDMEEYNSYQPHPMESHMLSPIYTKEDHGFHGMHPQHQEFIAAAGINPHMAHLSPQPIVDPNQHHHLQHHGHHQQHQPMHIHPQAQMQVHHAQHPHHPLGQAILMPVPSMMMHPNDGVEFAMEENNIEIDGSLVPDNNSNINQIVASNPQIIGIENHLNFNNNIVNDNENDKVEPAGNVENELSYQQPNLVITTEIPANPAESNYVPNVVHHGVHASTSPLQQMPVIDNGSHVVHNNNNTSSTKPAHHHNPFSQPSQQSLNMSHPTPAISASILSSTVMSTEELDKLAKSTSDKLIIKSDRSNTYNSAKMNHSNNNHHNNNNNNVNHNSNQKSSNAAWNYNKKNTVNVSVSAVPMHNPPNVLLPTPKQPLIAHTPSHRLEFGNHTLVPSVPKPFVPKPHQQAPQQTQSPQPQPAPQAQHQSLTQPQQPQPIPPPQQTLPQLPPQQPHSIEEHIEHQPTPPIVDISAIHVKPTVATTSIASTAVPQQLQQELRSKQVEVVPHLLIKENSEIATNPEPSIAPITKDTVRVTNNTAPQPKEEAVAPNIVPPPVQINVAPSAAATSTWASLFVNNKVDQPQVDPMASKKLVAKVQPFDTNNNNSITTTTASSTNATQSQPPKPSNQASLSTSKNNTASAFTVAATLEDCAPVPPKPVMSYSAASAQGLPAVSSPINKKTLSKAAVGPTKAGLSNDDSSSLKLGEFFQKYKVDNNAISLRPRGLVNRSNYCYMNASLQALVACPPFYNLLKSIPQHHIHALRSKASTPTIDAMIDLVNEFSPLPPGSRLTTRRGDRGGHSKKDEVAYDLVCDPSFEPTIIHKLWNSSRSEHEGRQEDAEEFLSYLLNKLNDEMLELKKLVEKPQVSVPNGEAANEGGDDGDEWKLIDNKNKGTVTRSTDFGSSPLSDIFRGIWRSRLQRENDTSADTLQPFFTLQLNIDKAASVKEALDNFFGRDQLDGFTCSKTNQAVMAWQQMALEKLPVVMVLHLKWFNYKVDGCTKILKTVEFPIELKIDSKIVSSKKYSKNQKQYKLFAVVYHDGKDASKGHYIIDAYHCGYSYWLRYDDSTVKPVAESSVLHPRAPRVPYLLYYRRYDTVIAPTTESTSKSSSGTNK